jgi:hypothetical protein
MPDDKKVTRRFDRLLEMMAAQPEPEETPQADSRKSGTARGAGYGDTQTREGTGGRT